MEANLNTGETLIPVLLEKIVVLEKVVASDQEVHLNVIYLRMITL